LIRPVRSETRARSQRGVVAHVTLVFGAAAGATLVALVVRHRLQTFPDSAIYLGTARNLLHGRGLTSPVALPFSDYFSPLREAGFHGALPITTHAPMYPLLIAFIGLFTTVTTAARVVGVVALAAATALVGDLALRLTRRWYVSAAVMVLFLLGGPVTGGAFVPSSWILLAGSGLAETLFLVFLLASIAPLTRGLRTGDTVPLVVAGAAIGLAIVSRFIGVSVLVAALLLVALRPRWLARDRVRAALIVGLPALVPVVVWRVVLRLTVGLGTTIPVRFHSMQGAHPAESVRLVGGWFLPSSAPHWALYGAAVLAAVVLVGAGIAGARAIAGGRVGPAWHVGPDGDDDEEVGWLLAVLVVVQIAYLIAIAATGLFLVANTGFDSRFLAIVRPMLYLTIVGVAFRSLSRLATGTAAATVTVAALLVVVPSLGPTTRLVRHGVASTPSSPALASAIRALPAHALLVSNAPDAVYGDAGRASVLVAQRWFATSDRANPSFSRDLGQVGELLKRPDSYLVMFDRGPDTDLATAQDIMRVVRLVPVATFPGAAIYRAAT